jgi:endonuclease/exonuclease/phosphatase family metal-dependent hydrolase
MVGEHSFEPPAIRLLTLNAHQGFNAFRRRKLLSCIRDALRASGADLVFLREVGGDHGEDIPQQHYELLADPGVAAARLWPQCRRDQRSSGQRAAVEVFDRSLAKRRCVGGRSRAAKDGFGSEAAGCNRP